LTNRIVLNLKYRNENKDSLRSTAYKISDNVRLNVLKRRLTINLKGEYTNRIDGKYDLTRAAPWYNTRYILYAVEGEVKYMITAKLAATLKLTYERSYDENDGGENYAAKIGGLHVNYLF
jgi:hypothetical protein